MAERERLHPNSSIDTSAGFESFIPFVAVSDPVLREKFIVYLGELHDLTNTVWRPIGCYGVEYFEQQVKLAQRNGDLMGIKFTIKSFAGGAHYHIVAEIDGCELIIDPFGVPTPGKDYYRDSRTIIPFFGDLSLAPEHHRSIYLDSQELGARGYHRFVA